jgi:aminopeptidase YwaD
MNKLWAYLFFTFLFFSSRVNGQNFESEIRAHLAALTSGAMHGRGYVQNGRDIAATYIVGKLREYKVQPVNKEGQYAQAYNFSVNTFPGKMRLVINDDSLRPGVDFLIDPASSSFKREDLSIKKINLGSIKDSASMREMINTLDTGYAYYLKNLDDFCQNTGIRKDIFLQQLPAGCYIVHEEKKLTWSVSRDAFHATVFYVRKLPAILKKVSVNVEAEYVQASRSINVMGQVPGEVKDTFIVFTSHYDHLGMMGNKTYFPGASDNASGVAMLLSLASYFSNYPQHYSILFIAFAGEEAGLMGSEFYVWKPMIPLANMKFLTNIDIMGDATNGITVVNATKYPDDFLLLQRLNEAGKYVPEIRSRGEAANSDHYYFSEAGVPSFFIYSNGGPGHYHDVFDVKSEVTLNNVERVRSLLIDFVKAIK